MFSPQSPSRINIEEANKHLQMLHNRISEMEQTIQNQTETIISLESKCEELENNNKELVRTSTVLENESVDLKARLEVSEQHFKEEKLQNDQKDVAINNLKGYCKNIAEIVSYQPMLQDLVSAMSKVSFDGTKKKIHTQKSRNTTPQTIDNVNGSTENASGKAAYHSPSGSGSSRSTKFLQRTINHKMRNISVSDDDSDDVKEDGKNKVLQKTKRDKEMYL